MAHVFPHRFMAHARSAQAVNWRGKTRVCNLQYGLRNKVSKTFIISLYLEIECAKTIIFDKIRWDINFNNNLKIPYESMLGIREPPTPNQCWQIISNEMHYLQTLNNAKQHRNGGDIFMFQVGKNAVVATICHWLKVLDFAGRNVEYSPLNWKLQPLYYLRDIISQVTNHTQILDILSFLWNRAEKRNTTSHYNDTNW